MASYHRDISPILKLFRAIFRGRGWNQQLRYQEQLAPRPYPKPNPPLGPSHKAYNNHYFNRDGRRCNLPPIEIINATKQLSSAQNTSKASDSLVAPKPGNIYRWD